MGSVCQCLLNIILFPFYLAGGLVFICLWGVFTFSGIGPLVQYILTSYDFDLLDREKVASSRSDIHILTVPANVNSATGSEEYKLVARFTVPANHNPSLPPVALPNGLGATLVLTSVWHEELARRGYRVLSWDRLGVGFSDDNPTGKSPTAPDIIREMDFVLNHFSQNEKWVLLGGSMGAIVAMCYISAFPSKVCGFVDMDGVPYPFISAKKGFQFAASIYKFYTYIIWTGIFRPFIALGFDANFRAKLTSKSFSIDYVIAQINQTRFFANIGLEMSSMMDLCEFATVAWGAQDVMKLDPETFDALVRARPHESVVLHDVTGLKSVTIERSPSERGGDWADDHSVETAIDKLKSLAEATVHPLSSNDDIAKSNNDGNGNVCVPARVLSEPNLPRMWPNLCVYVMSGRNHDFGSEMMNSFYNQDLRDQAAAEHTQLVHLAYWGKRVIYPKCTHNQMFLMTDEVCNGVDEVVLQVGKKSAV